ncbi:MAG: NAD+ synthase [Opitutales bacterium]
MKIGLAQINTTVGDLAGNTALIREAYDRCVADGADLVLFPELALCGYPPRDLLLRSRFLIDTREALDGVAGNIGRVPALIGFAAANPAERGRRCFNAAAWCVDGQVTDIARKCLLPTYDVFDEDRYFEPAEEPLIVTYRGKRIGVTICEDIWVHPEVETSRHYKFDPVDVLAKRGIDLLINVSASPWHLDKNKFRRDLIADAARTCGCPVAYCNAVGGNDELIFDGKSMLMAADGTLLDGLAGFAPETRVGDLDAPAATGRVSPTFDQETLAAVRDALCLGLRDYAHKSGFRSMLISLSGGIDSAVVAALAVHAFGPDQVMGISLPSAISSQHSQDDAADLARNLGIAFHKLPIAGVVDAATEVLGPLFGDRPPDVTEENLQARSRSLLMMALSNKFGKLLLTTGNKSELAVGYCTLYGDMCGGLAVISDVPKMLVFDLARFINRDAGREVIPENTISKPPSAELRPDQKDEDSLPSYPVLDEILRLYVEEGKSRREVVAAGFDATVVDEVARKVDLNEYKRKQAAPGLKITPLAFGVGRRIPIVQKYVN